MTRTCGGFRAADAVWTDGRGRAACGRTDEHGAHLFTPWACGNPGCDRPLSWHANRAGELLRTEGPDAEREFEMDHPDSEEDDDGT